LIFNQASWKEPLLSEISKKNRRGFSLSSINPKINAKIGDVDQLIPKKLRRDRLNLPSISEPEVVRHFVRLSQMSFGVDCGIYPLGSCTMKYNPKLSERIVLNPKLKRMHPYQPEETSQGILEILHRLSKLLAEITGTARITLLPSAGAHGEFVGALIMRAYARERGELSSRNEILVPDSAHGTNPASAAMAGFKVVRIPSDENGLVDIEALKSIVSSKTAGIMLTVPNTLGIFEQKVTEISQIIHESGGLMYYDGANMNALLGMVRPGDMGFDIVHINVHKTFSTPHGGGGPGAGPVGVSSELVDFLPIPTIEFEDSRYFLNYNLPKSIGKIKSYYGNTAVLVKTYAYILMMGRDGLKKVSEQSVLSANYLLKKIDQSNYYLPYNSTIPRKHEFVVSVTPLKEKTGVTAMDIAKALLDRGIHAPTIYFPPIVEEALMIEPTETETVEDLDRLAESLNEISQIAKTNPESIKKGPKKTSIGRLDEVKASHPLTMKLNWRN
jgi:glycine dehydrogenase subunit 2